tara:strand:- start:212 stop:541 length:330 start_codon:yes stop_codon:yes gene_type:complete
MAIDYTPFVDKVHAIADLYTNEYGTGYIEKGNFGNDYINRAAQGDYGPELQAVYSSAPQMNQDTNIASTPPVQAPLGVNDVWDSGPSVLSTPWWSSPSTTETVTPEVSE